MTASPAKAAEIVEEEGKQVLHVGRARMPLHRARSGGSDNYMVTRVGTMEVLVDTTKMTMVEVSEYLAQRATEAQRVREAMEAELQAQRSREEVMDDAAVDAVPDSQQAPGPEGAPELAAVVEEEAPGADALGVVEVGADNGALEQRLVMPERPARVPDLPQQPVFAGGASALSTPSNQFSAESWDLPSTQPQDVFDMQSIGVPAITVPEDAIFTDTDTVGGDDVPASQPRVAQMEAETAGMPASEAPQGP